MDNLLPDSLKDIAQAIGFEKVMILVGEYGGQRLWIPKQPTLDWAVVSLLGYEAAYKLSYLLGGNQIEVPSCRFLSIEERNQKIRRDRATHTIEALAKKYSLRREWIRKIVRSCDNSPALQHS